jgi:monofunctional biosynthetic peptidoglycan transglycosylase
MMFFPMLLILTLNLQPWQAVNDGVMGGISSGRMVAAGEGLRFEGDLSLENNGGFASVRRLVVEDLAGMQRVRLQVRGDGRNYQFRIRQDNGFDGVAWRQVFSTTESWQTVELPFEDFEPVFRGRPVPQAGPVEASRIRQIGFLIADKTPGPFALEIRAIEFIGGQAKEP